MVPIEKTKHNTQPMLFLQKAQNVTRIAKVKEIFIFVWVRVQHDINSQFFLQMLLILSKISVSKYFKKIYRCIYVLKYSKEKGCILVPNAFAFFSECHISFIALKLDFVG